MSNLEWSKMTDEQLFTKAPTPDEIRQQERERIINELKRTTTRFEIPLQAGELKELWENFLRDNIIKIINLEVENSGNKKSLKSNKIGETNE